MMRYASVSELEISSLRTFELTLFDPVAYSVIILLRKM